MEVNALPVIVTGILTLRTPTLVTHKLENALAAFTTQLDTIANYAETITTEVLSREPAGVSIMNFKIQFKLNVVQYAHCYFISSL